MHSHKSTSKKALEIIRTKEETGKKKQGFIFSIKKSNKNELINLLTNSIIVIYFLSLFLKYSITKRNLEGCNNSISKDIKFYCYNFRSILNSANILFVENILISLFGSFSFISYFGHTVIKIIESF
ncbi:MAG: hypothetical protein ACE5SW_12655 [Nitrososphaeraceae archaeon]